MSVSFFPAGWKSETKSNCIWSSSQKRKSLTILSPRQVFQHALLAEENKQQYCCYVEEGIDATVFKLGREGHGLVEALFFCHLRTLSILKVDFRLWDM